MKIIKAGLPVIILAAVFAKIASQQLDARILATADAGALPETKILCAKLFAPGIMPRSQTRKTRMVRALESGSTKLFVQASAAGAKW
jgi:hypothetical protein